MNGFIESIAAPRWTEAELEKFTIKQLNEIITHMPGYVVSSPEVTSFMNKQPCTPADRAYVMGFLNKKKAGSILTVGKFEETVMVKGGHVEYTKDEIIVKSPETKDVIYQAGVIPVETTRSGIMLPLVFICSVFEIRKGVVEQKIKDADFFKIFGIPGSRLNGNGIAEFRGTFISLLDNTAVSKTVLNRQVNCTGADFQKLMSATLTTCAYVDYFAIHTAIARKVFSAFTVEQGRVRMATGVNAITKQVGPIFPTGTFTEVLPTGLGPVSAIGHSAFVAATGYNPVMWRKGVSSAKSFPTKQGDLISAMRSQRAARSFRGGDSGGVSGIFSADGFVSNTSDLTRKLMTLVGAANYLLTRNKILDIACGLGELAIIYKCLLHAWGDEGIKQVRFIFPAEKLVQIRNVMLNHCIPVRRTGVHYLTVNTAALPGYSSINEGVELERASTVEASYFGEHFTIFRPIYGKAIMRHPMYYVRRPWDFFGCISTIPPGFKCGAIEYPLVPVDPNEWYDKVYDANSWTVNFFINPDVFFNEYVNVLRMPAQGVMTYVEGEGYVASLQEYVDPNDVAFSLGIVVPEKNDTGGTISTIGKDKEIIGDSDLVCDDSKFE